MFAPPPGLSQLAASFIDFLCQGIHRAPLVSSSVNESRSIQAPSAFRSACALCILAFLPERKEAILSSYMSMMRTTCRSNFKREVKLRCGVDHVCVLFHSRHVRERISSMPRAMQMSRCASERSKHPESRMLRRGEDRAHRARDSEDEFDVR